MIPKNPFIEEVRVVTGIDVGTSAIKMVSMRKNEAGKPEILKVSRYPLDGADPSPENPEARARLVQALRAARDAHGIPLGVGAFALPRERTIIRYLTLPSTNPAELKEMLMFDIERHVPFPLDKIQIDHSIVETREDSSVVKVAAAPLEEIEAWMDVFEEAGIQVEVVDVDVLAACASYTFDSDDTTPVRAVLDIGRSRCNLGVLSGAKVRFSRTATFGENRLREYLGMADSKEHPERSDPRWVKDLAMEMNRLLHAYECEEGTEGIKEIILCGGAAKIEGLDRELAGALGRRVRAVPPELHGIGGVDGVASPELTVAIGLALRSVDQPDINLIPDKVLAKRERIEKRRVNRNIAIYAGIVLFLLGGIVGVKFQAKFAHRARLLAALSNIEPKIKDIRRKKAEIDAIRANIDQENSFYNVLKELYRITPDNVMYLTINFEKRKQLDLRGRVPTDQDFLNLMNVLKESKYFKDVQPGPYKWVNMYNKVAVREFDTSSCILRTNEDYRTRRAPRAAGRK